MAQVSDYIVSNQTFPNTRADINNILEAIGTNNSGTTPPTNQLAGQFWIDTTTTTWTLYIHDGTDDIQFATIDTSANTVNFTDSALDVVTDTTPQLGGNLDLNSNDITGTGNINITGNITASGNLAGTLTTASQPNITSVGTLTSATVSGDLTVDTSTLHVDSANNRVGIGTTSPASKFEVEDSVNGDMHLRINNTNTGASARTFLLMQSDGATGSIYLNGANSAGSGTNQANSMTLTSDATASNGLNINATSGAIKFYYNNSETMRIDSSGNVLVGTTDYGVGGTTNTGIALNPNGASAISRSSNPPITLNRTTTDGNIVLLRKDGTDVGSIGVKSTDNLYIADSNNAGITFIGTGVSPVDSSGTGNPNALDLGDSYNTWKDLYLAGNIYLGGTGSANALDDYEEGTFTPVVSSGSGTITSTSSETGLYVKIGKMVTVCVTAIITNNGTGASNVKYTLPFTNSSGLNFQASGRENNITGIQLQASINNGTSEIVFRKSDNSYPGGTSYQLQTTISYFTD